MRALIFGCGYVGLSLGAELSRQGHEVWGARRSAAGRQELANAGIRPVVADITDPSTFESLPPGCEWVVNCTSAGGGGAQEYRRVYLEGNRNLIARFSASPPKKFVYTSSTGVYRQMDGSIVDEASQVRPVGGTTGVLVETEQLLLEAAGKSGFPAVILRVAGIYGPERGFWLRQFLSGAAVMEGAGSRHLNMIHRDDVAGAILCALERGKPGEIYNAVDDEPATQFAVFEWLSHRLSSPMPSAQSTQDAPSRRTVTDKIVSNRKLRMELDWQLRYRTFREGYEAELRRMAK